MPTLLQTYEAWKTRVLGHRLDIDHAYGDQCVDVDLSYGQALWPTVPWSTVYPPVPYAKLMFSNHNPKYFDAILDRPGVVSWIPRKGDVIIFHNAIAGHTGVVDSADAHGVTIVEQNGRSTAQTSTDVAHMAHYLWGALPVIGWLRPKYGTPLPTPQYIIVKSGWGLSSVAAAAGLKNPDSEQTWAAISKLNGSSNWVTYNAHLKVGQRVRVR